MKLPINYDNSHWSVRQKARNEYIRLQEGICYHCGELLSGKPSADVLSKKINKKFFPPNMFKHPVHLHHCHNTGLTLGAVHSICNAVLWQYYGE